VLLELAVKDLGIIDDLRLVLAPGMTVLTGETGAGKTMLVEALELLVGGRADPLLVRPGAEAAEVEGRFELDGEEVVLARVVPADGRSRAYIDGRMATAGALAEAGARLVDLHGQHDHQSLLAAAVQRDALDRFAGIDLGPLHEARAEVDSVARRLADLGGDAGARAREVDLLRYQVDELERAALGAEDEDEHLDAEETELADASAHRAAAWGAAAALSAEGGTRDALAGALAELTGRAPFAEETERLAAVIAEVDDLATTLQRRGELIEEDPERLDALRVRRQLLADLRRKYGTASTGTGTGAGTLADVLAYRDHIAGRLDELERHEEVAADLARAARAAAERVARAEAVVAKARRAAAPDLASRVQAHLPDLAMGGARLEVEVGGDGPADEVRFLLAANPGSPPRPLAKVASGGELARAMLALRLVLTAAPPTLVFDEVDAGIGGEAAITVGRALARLGRRHQVLVVTHLPQVAAFADAQVTVTKTSGDAETVARARQLERDERIVELSRMLSGTPQSATAREHAAELLAAAAAERGA
jgi:DNA repair protein RecN (Recombination protein N)